MKLIRYETYALRRGFTPVINLAVVDFEAVDVELWATSCRDWIQSQTREQFTNLKRDLPFEGVMLYGVFPLNQVRGNEWECSVDYGEEIVSHHQHYRNRNVPFATRRMDFTTVDMFRKLLAEPRVKHVIIDSITHQLLVDEFDSFEKDAQIASATEIKDGLVLTLGGVQIFADTYVPRDRQWVNETPGNPYARPQFIVVEPHFEKPYPPQETV